ncbi:hypothetical protein P3T76_005676 [Phytophthora citrophthora]|uniref:Uncharacterized protein n=1 Tax=Phytophthora citrophthora TaxID=4793 RepID=A0AAD9GR50_9STRA|nr:hypothetical protein P3T76_005676 [Phytophthora citrophthora]
MKLNVEVIRKENFAIGVNQLAVLRGLIMEKEALRRENMALCEQAKKHRIFHKTLTTQAGEEGDTTFLPVDNDKGWWIHFANASPSFYYHPYSPEEVYRTAGPLDPKFTAALRLESKVGTFLGWNISRHFCSETLVSRVYLSKRVLCSLDRALKVIVEKEEELRPLLKTPPGWNFTQRHDVSAQVLQEIDPFTRVMIHDISGCHSVRYVFVARSAQWEIEPSKRKMGVSMIIIDSKANKLSRDSAEHDNGQWMTRGWSYCTLTEVNDGVVDVEYRHCTGCSSETHAGVLMAQWVQFLVRWEQIAVRTNLIRC